MRKYKLSESFQLESGAILPEVEIAYHTFGQLNDKKDNVVWVCHALTANSDVMDWWEGLFGEDDLFNPKDYFIVCANVLGSHYGTTNPLSINPKTKEPYFHNFPLFTIRDFAALHIELANHLGIEKINVLTGGSLGGQQALEWSILEPERIRHLVLLATNAAHSPWGIAFNESQRMAIEADQTWAERHPDAGLNGMKTARSMALLSYRNYATYDQTQSRKNEEVFPDRAGSYQRYQGEKLARRFNAFSYWYLSKAMDSHNVGRNRGGVEAALKRIQAKTLVLTLENDILFPDEEQERLAAGIFDADYHKIPSVYGHDGFLIEVEKIGKVIRDFLMIKVNGKKRRLAAHERVFF